MGAEIAQTAFVSLDLLANAGQLPLHREHVLELAGATREQVDEAALEPLTLAARAVRSTYLTYVLGRDVHPLDPAQRSKAP